MKIVELVNKIKLPITNEEADLLGKIVDKKQIYKKDLQEREIVLANHLVNKDVLLRIKNNGQIYFTKKT